MMLESVALSTFLVDVPSNCSKADQKPDSSVKNAASQAAPSPVSSWLCLNSRGMKKPSSPTPAASAVEIPHF